MANITALRVALANNLENIPGLQQSAFLLSSPTPPAAEIQPGKTDYHKAMRDGLDRHQFIVRVFVQFSTDIGSQMTLDGFLADSGATSVKAALESDPTLGGLANDLIVTGNTGYQVFLREVAGISGRGSASGSLIGSEWTVEVFTA